MPEFDVAVIGAGTVGRQALAALRREHAVNIVALEKTDDPGLTRHPRAVAKPSDVLRHVRFAAEVVAEEFDDTTDGWTISTRDGTTVTARVVVDSTRDGRGRAEPGRQAAARRGRPELAPYLDIASHGVPNHFVVSGPDAAAEQQIRNIATLVRVMRRREATRVEVKRHVHQQADRLQEGPPLGTTGSRRPRLGRRLLSVVAARRLPHPGDFEFTRSEDREDDDGYCGPAVLVDDDGAEYPVQVHVLAQYEPVDDTVHWSGRVAPTPVLTRLHRARGQRIALRLPGRAAVTAHLSDADPWGGAHILGRDVSPYPFEHDASPSSAPPSTARSS